MRKEKHAAPKIRALQDFRFLQKYIPLPGILLLAASLFFPFSSALAAGDVTLSTRNSESGIVRDPATGNREITTPQARPQPEYQGPQTVIVAPEVYPGPGAHPGKRPGQGDGRYGRQDGGRHDGHGIGRGDHRQPSRGSYPQGARPGNQGPDTHRPDRDRQQRK